MYATHAHVCGRYCVYGPPLPKDPKTNPDGIKCGGAGVGLATSKTPQAKESWVRHGYNCNNGTADNCGKSAAILIRDTGPVTSYNACTSWTSLCPS